MKDVAFLDLFGTKGDNVRVLAPALAIGIVQLYGALFSPGIAATFGQDLDVEGAQFARRAHSANRPFNQAQGPLYGERRKIRRRPLDDGDKFNFNLVLVHVYSPF